jgi:hypothetical protein
MARLLYELLKKRKYNVFFDHKTLSTGEYEEKLLNIISSCKDFIVVFSEDCFKVEGKSGLFYMKEIKQALESDRKIIPLMIDGFVDPDEAEIKSFSDPDTVRRVIKNNGKKIRVDFCKFIRDERRFGSIDELVAEINQNIKEIREYFGE